VANATHSVPTDKRPWRKEKAMNQVPAVPSNRITVLYCRVSTQDQVGGLESQIRTLKEFCEKNSITNYQLFTDHGISGAKISRPALDSMMALVRKGGVGEFWCIRSQDLPEVSPIFYLRWRSFEQKIAPSRLTQRMLIRIVPWAAPSSP
jgi:hypothetical protein